MIKATTHTINHAVLQFNYQGRASAVRCNEQIALAYESHIFPLLRETLTNAIPLKASLSVEKLEIDLGYIREKELIPMLLERLKSTLNLELFKVLAIRHSTGDLSGDPQKYFTTFINDAIALFMNKGYYPHWISAGFTLQQLVEKSLKQSPEYFLEMLHRYAANDTAIKRLLNDTTPAVVEDIIARLEPTESDWIKNYRKWLLQFFKSRAFFGITEKNLSLTLDFYMLQYVLRRNSLLFDRARFSAFVLDGLSTSFNLNPETYSNALLVVRPPILDNAAFSELVHAYVQKIRSSTAKVVAPVSITSEKAIHLLNSSFKNITAEVQAQLRSHLTTVMRDRKVFKQYIVQLSEEGLQALITLNYKGDARLVLQLMHRFAALSKVYFVRDATTAMAVMISSTLDYLRVNPNAKHITPLYIAYLANAIELSESFIKSEAFQKVLEDYPNENNIIKQAVTAVDEADITNLKQTIRRSVKRELEKRAHHESPAFKTHQALLSSFRDNVLAYLETGRPGLKNTQTYQSEIEMQFLFLIDAGDQFLVDLITEGKQPESVLKRIQKLYHPKLCKSLYGYLQSHFAQSLTRFENYMATITDKVTAGQFAVLELNADTQKITTLLKALFDSQGGLYPNVFNYAVSHSVLEILQSQQTKTHPTISLSCKTEHQNIQEALAFERELLEVFILKGWQSDLIKDIALSQLSRVSYKLLERKDAILSTILTTSRFEESIYERVLTLITQPFQRSIQSYLDHYFPKEVQLVGRLVKSIARFRESENNTNLTGYTSKVFRGHSLSVFQNTLAQMMCEAVIYGILHRTSKMTKAQFEVVVYTFIEDKWSSYNRDKIQQISTNTTSVTTKESSTNGLIMQTDWSKLGPDRLPDDQNQSDLPLEINKLDGRDDTPELFLDRDSDRDTAKVRHPQISNLKEEPKRAKSDEIDRLKAVGVIISTIKFYLAHEVLPWWSEMRVLEDMVTAVDGLQAVEIALLESELEALLQVKRSSETSEDKKQLALSQKRYHTISQILRLLKFENGKTVSLESPIASSLAPVLQEPALLAQVSNNAAWDEPAIFQLLYRYKDEQLLKAYWGTFKNGLSRSSQYLALALVLEHYDIRYSKWRTAFYTFLLKRPLAERRKLSNHFDGSLLYFLNRRYSDIAWSQIFTDIYLRSRQERENTMVKLPEGLEQIIAKKAKKLYREITKTNTDDFMEEEITIAVPNAGLIILGAYLPQYFERLGLTENGNFIDAAAQNRGVYLLQYLGFESVDFSEYNLVLNKILVGMPLDELVTPIAAVTQEEKDLSTSLLTGVVHNWERMQNTTLAGLRETFLQREGMLKLNDEYYDLQIERRGLDILLEGIPWNISILNLSWMEKPLHIKW